MGTTSGDVHAEVNALRSQHAEDVARLSERLGGIEDSLQQLLFWSRGQHAAVLKGSVPTGMPSHRSSQLGRSSMPVSGWEAQAMQQAIKQQVPLRSLRQNESHAGHPMPPMEARGSDRLLENAVNAEVAQPSGILKSGSEQGSAPQGLSTRSMGVVWGEHDGGSEEAIARSMGAGEASARRTVMFCPTPEDEALERAHLLGVNPADAGHAFSDGPHHREDHPDTWAEPGPALPWHKTLYQVIIWTRLATFNQ